MGVSKFSVLSITWKHVVPARSECYLLKNENLINQKKKNGQLDLRKLMSEDEDGERKCQIIQG